MPIVEPSLIILLTLPPFPRATTWHHLTSALDRRPLQRYVRFIALLRPAHRAGLCSYRPRFPFEASSRTLDLHLCTPVALGRPPLLGFGYQPSAINVYSSTSTKAAPGRATSTPSRRLPYKRADSTLAPIVHPTSPRRSPLFAPTAFAIHGFALLLGRAGVDPARPATLVRCS
jgi:hypothetical protein